MKAPLYTTILTIALVSLFLSVPTVMNSQVELEISTLEPEFITPCGETAVFSVVIKNDNVVPVDDVEFTYRFTDGIQYVPGTVQGLDIIELDITDLAEPVFSIASLPGGLELTFSVEGQASCEVLDNTGQIVNQSTVVAQAETFTNITPPFNINVPSISITNAFNLNYQAGVGEQFQRGITVTNSGFGEVTELYVLDAHETSELPVLSMTPGTFWPTGNDTTAVVLSGADFMMIGDGDGILEQGEEIDILQTLEVLGCESINGTITIGWGCGGEICDFFQTASQVSVLTEIPELDLVIGDNQFAGYCTNGLTEVKLVNVGSPGYTGEATAFNIVIEAGWYPVPIGNNDLGRNDCLQMSDFTIGVTSLTVDTNQFGGYGIQLDQLPFDPDGPGGLDDLDGDGAFDDLALGDTLTIFVQTQFDASCFTGDCNFALNSTILGIESDFDNQCGETFSGQAADPSIQYQLSQPAVADNFS
ncbi:MAG: hypothetical protein AAGH79_14180, partial [Bacteroidota bacterium]